MSRRRLALVLLAAAAAGCGDDAASAGGEPPASDHAPAAAPATPEREAPAKFAPGDERRFAALVESVGVAAPAIALPPRDRDTIDDRGTLLLFPRGKVRAADLDVYRVDTDYALTGTLTFECAGKLLHEEQLATEELVTERPIPDAVKAAVKPGDRVRWRFRTSDGEDRSADFELAKDDPAPKLALAAERVDPSATLLAAQVSAAVLDDLGFHVAAWREARRVALETGSRPAWKIVQTALVGLGTEVSRLGDEARTALAKLDAERAAQRRK